MNYIREINAFYDWLETNLLSTSGIVLWHALMAINNKAGWAAEFGVAVSVLCVKTGLAARTISQARNELAQKGRIKWRPRKGNQSALYSIIPLSASHADSYADKYADNHADSYADKYAALNKQNKTINNNDDDARMREIQNVFQKFHESFNRTLGPLEIDQINNWLVTSSVELIEEALKRSVMRGKYNFAYIDRILLNWHKNNIQTLHDIEEQDQEFEKNKGGSANGPTGPGTGKPRGHPATNGGADKRSPGDKYSHIDFSQFEFEPG